VSAARLKLRDDAYWAASPTGVAILTHQGTVTLTGASVARWFERLAPFLDGGHTLAELTASLPPERRQRVKEIVTILLDRGVVRTVGDDSPHSLAAPDVATYQAELEFIGYFQDSAATAFARYRASAALVLGAGRLLPAVVRASLRSGLRDVRVVVTPDAPTDTAALGACAEQARRRDGAQRLDWHAAALGGAGDPAAALVRMLDGAELVVHACDAPVVARARLLDRLCAQRGIPLVQAMADGGEVWLSPAGRVGADSPGASDGWQRRAALAKAVKAVNSGADVGTPWAGPPTAEAADPATAATVVANQLVHDLFRYATGLRPPPRRPQLTRIDLGTMASREYRFLTHPFSVPATASTEAEFLGRVRELDTGQPLDAEEFSRRAATCTDARLGVFGEITERGFAQLPMHVCQTVVSDPVGLLGPGTAAPVVTGTGVGFAAARCQAALRALETYASLMVDPRRLLTRGGTALLFPAVGTPDDPHIDSLDSLHDLHDLHGALAALRASELDGWVHALDLAEHRPRLLLADQVFPVLSAPGTRPSGRPGLPYRRPLGVAAAYSWPEALQAGLVRHCRQLTVADALASAEAFPLVPLEDRPPAGAGGVPAGEASGWYRSMVAALGEPVAVYDITGPFGVPTFACLLAGRTVAYGCAASASDALADGLGRLLLAYQARVEGEPAYAPAPVPELPPHLRGTATRTRPLSADPPLDVAALVAALARRGYHAAAVPLDHDPAVRRTMPYVAHVVVTDAGR
jgi:ribosomal protein S12 methylthiotransferase accessory factor YcaO